MEGRREETMIEKKKRKCWKLPKLGILIKKELYYFSNKSEEFSV